MIELSRIFICDPRTSTFLPSNLCDAFHRKNVKTESEGISPVLIFMLIPIKYVLQVRLQFHGISNEDLRT
jgi:hypothetical protein